DYVTVSPSNKGEILSVTLDGLDNRSIKGTFGPTLGALYKLSFAGEPGTTSPSDGLIAAQRRFAGHSPLLIT
ncbi:hypothetical protein A2U01_0072332, partial [Trifolium medium]|nr:hypothetical protein [Trifolium medium]